MNTERKKVCFEEDNFGEDNESEEWSKSYLCYLYKYKMFIYYRYLASSLN